MYQLHIPAPLSHIPSECQIAEKYFHDDRPADDVDVQIFTKNPYQVVTVTDETGQVLAYADMFVLQPNVYRQLMSDQLTEDDLKEEHFLPWPFAAQATRIYLAGIAVGDQNHPARSQIANSLLHGCLRLMEKYYLVPGKEIECSMIAYSESGARIAKRLNFAEQGSHTHGILYKRPMTLELIHKLYTLLPPVDPAFTITE